MNKLSVANAELLSGKICGFFARNVFLLGLIISISEAHCQIIQADGTILLLPINRLVLISRETYCLSNPQDSLSAFIDSMQKIKATVQPESIRQLMLQSKNDLTLVQITDLLKPEVYDEHLFALYDEVRYHPTLFRIKKGIYHANTVEEEMQVQKEQEMQELHRRDIEICPLLARKHLPVCFSESLLRAAEQVPSYVYDSTRQDLTNLICWTIDAQNSRDMDDAISLTPLSEGWELGIHIADAGYFIKPQTSLDAEAAKRTSSIYLTDLDVHMLPESISCDKSSLKAGEIRPVLSVICQIDDYLQIISHDIFPAQIRVRENLSYDLFDDILDQEVSTHSVLTPDMAKLLFELCETHRQEREKLSVVKLPQYLLPPARRVVAECMIIYNSFLAKLALNNSIHLFYRYLEATEAGLDNISEMDFLPPAGLSTIARPHTAMGLKVYGQFSSPLRRYSDLVNQRQITAMLRHVPLPYSKGELDAMIEPITRLRNLIRQITYSSDN